MNDMTFRTGGSWETTSLYTNGREVAAAQLFVELLAGRDDFGNPMRGGIWEGIDFTAIVRPEADPLAPVDIFPGRLLMEFPGHQIIIENHHPMVDLLNTRLWYNGEEITDRVIDVYVDVNAVDDVVQAYVTVYKSHFFRSDEAITYTIVA